MNKSYKEYLEEINDIMEFVEGDECAASGDSYWTSKSGESFSIDCGYFWEGLEAFRAYFKKKLDEENGNVQKRPVNVQCRWCKEQFKFKEDPHAYQEYSPDYANSQRVDRWIWHARCPRCKSYVPVEEVKASE